MKALFRNVLALGVVGASLFAANTAQADVSIVTQTVSAQVNSIASLNISSTTLTFPSASPASVTSIAANENGITVTVNARTGLLNVATLTVVAITDLLSGLDIIPINNVTWTATGTGFQSGTLNKILPGTVGTWTGPGIHTGTLNFFLANSYAYVTGSYTATLTYTLTAL